MCHVFLEKDLRAIRNGARAFGGDSFPPAVLSCDNLISTGVKTPCVADSDRKTVVPDDRIGSFSQARIIAVEMLRGPDHMAIRKLTVRSHKCFFDDEFGVEPLRFSTIGPRSPLPKTRPSTDLTGATPAKVPVTNASSAP